MLLGGSLALPLIRSQLALARLGGSLALAEVGGKAIPLLLVPRRFPPGT